MIKTYNDINLTYLDILSELKNNGQIRAKRREISFLTFTLTDMDKNILFFPFAARNWPWILRECSDRIFCVKNPGTAYHFSKNWENRIEENGYYSYSYAERLNTQMQNVLKNKKLGRDKIVSVWQQSDYIMNGRQPCTIIMQPFIEEDGKFSLVVFFRNNDMINIFPSDVFIHSSYFKYWCVKSNIEYKNLYWISAVAYYQKKRDKLRFAERLLEQWKKTYKDVQTTKWNTDIINDLDCKEVLEKDIILDINLNKRRNNCYQCLEQLNTDYVKEWFKIIMLKIFKIDKDKKSFKDIQNSKWHTEFSLIKDSIKA